jgi:hypothetical protein
MFCKQFGLNGRLATQACKRFARPAQSRSYATGGMLAPLSTYTRNIY